MAELEKKIKDALFEARPYVEYFDKLKETINGLKEKTADEKEFKKLLEEKIAKAQEPFKTDLRIFLQKFEAL
ncbi:hypothetical protein [Thermococcus paralvinellae]|uniref:Uncharacterized protein n=1 Tax=Thermococcus paralvinellae TaxID=582419 RepID=W0I0Y6_9EURY|nr:hypothetical protein [Thermococcus paralvinellae]AHF79711.1 Hypothetical protein TES1_0317 [Thermococcus paralvinellae]